MTLRELEDQIVDLGVKSGLSVSDISAAMSRAKTRLLKGLATSSTAPSRSYKPLLRPGGKVMGKQKRATTDGETK